ncbi:hypothetical protein [Streptomyces sp. 4F14]|uniref:hypothetical protein n=1 Tax=Streptomyces sp. 4F14 TaxID=3394380 RepID=UPI003A86B393
MAYGVQGAASAVQVLASAGAADGHVVARHPGPGLLLVPVPVGADIEPGRISLNILRASRRHPRHHISGPVDDLANQRAFSPAAYASVTMADACCGFVANAVSSLRASRYAAAPTSWLSGSRRRLIRLTT